MQQSKPCTLTLYIMAYDFSWIFVPAWIVVPGMQLAVQVQDDCPITLNLWSLPVLNWKEERDAREGWCT